MGIVVCDISVSLNGFVAGPNQRLEAPLGDEGGEALHRWMFEQPEENAAEISAMHQSGAYIMGRNMFGPGRGAWDLSWEGWWGGDPPFDAPVFVLTHHPRETLVMKDGTEIQFVTDGIKSALAQAQAAAGDASVGIAGGAATVNAYLAAGLIDELRLHVAPITFRTGERLFEGVGNLTLEPFSVRSNELITHLTYRVIR